MSSEKLFAIYLGGRADRCNIELHDVVFAVGSSIEDTFPQLREKWFGSQERLHVDAFMELTYADGYQVLVSRQLPEATSAKKLFFVNFGAYEGTFNEVHQSGFFVAESSKEAIKKARDVLCIGLEQVHKDDVVSVDQALDMLSPDQPDDVVEVNKVGQWFIQLVPSTREQYPRPVARYLKINSQRDLPSPSKL